ncbi:MAG: ADP-dependent (S)-NAD(P)H-hydrate dehydratase [Candidatus Levybacteria bacterium]|nr:ADP-dependent (S)-NAD(P)H-hydrate dehydratase [Candidatus Levybacteria bacterium]
MKEFEPSELKKLYTPPSDSHKGQNGKLLLISGSKLFHSSSLWALKVASRIVDMVFYSSVDENNQIVMEAKQEFRDGIVVPRNKIENYIQEADCVLIGPGLPRKDGEQIGDDDTKTLTESLLKKYPNKKWVIDGGSLQTINPQLIPHNAILTPHRREFEMIKLKTQNSKLKTTFCNAEQNSKLQEQVKIFAETYGCTIVLKGPTDIVCGLDKSVRPPTLKLRRVEGGNAGMTKGGTGDVLAALIAGLYCKNEDPFLVASSGSFLNKKAGESLFKRVGYYFNASDLVNELPGVMKNYIL